MKISPQSLAGNDNEEWGNPKERKKEIGINTQEEQAGQRKSEDPKSNSFGVNWGERMKIFKAEPEAAERRNPFKGGKEGWENG